MAGLYNDYGGERRFFILTTDASASMEDTHDRMTVVLGEGKMAQWMDNYLGALDVLQTERPYAY